MKKVIILVISLAVILFPIVVFATDPADKPESLNKIDFLLQHAMEHKLIAGGVVLVGDSHEDLFCKAYGKLAGVSEAKPVETDSLFDIASLTKVVATTPAILKLVEEGKISLLDPVHKWFPEFVGKGKDDLLLFHLLTHTSGLRDLSFGKESLHNVIGRTASMTLTDRPGQHFNYADINFILLGELVARVTGFSLQSYAAQNIFAPLHMSSTGFNPGNGVFSRCAATLDDNNSCLFGRVQDTTAFLLGGVAGHAGLFSTAPDLSRYCRMLLNKGSLDGQSVLREQTVNQAITPYSFQNHKVLRGLGWDISSPFSSPRGEAFSMASFGHTGYSGCSIWIDPVKDVYVVVLTTRLDYKRKSEFNQLRGNLSTVAASLVDILRVKQDFCKKSRIVVDR